MIKLFFHKLGLHDWILHTGFYMYDQRHCKICNKVQRRKRNPNAQDVIEDGKVQEWRDVDVSPKYVRQ